MDFQKLTQSFLVAEISANHAQKFDRAVAMIKAAKKCGADAVKFQTYTPDTMTLNCDKPCFQIKHTQWKGQSLYRLYQQAYTPYVWFKKLKKVADSEGILFFSASFDKSAVDLLEEIDCPIHKIASFELVDHPLIAYIAKTKKPLIMSTGMATIKEIQDALFVARKNGAKQIMLLKCISAYPAPDEDMNLRTIPDMAKRFKCAVGLSDHSMGTTASVVAVTLGAKMVEKHFTLDKRVKTPDSSFSITPDEFARMVKDVRTAEALAGKAFYGLSPDEKNNRIFRRSLFVAANISKGQLLTEENIKSVRPAHGLPPAFLNSVIGRRAKKDITYGTPLSLNMIT